MRDAGGLQLGKVGVRADVSVIDRVAPQPEPSLEVGRLEASRGVQPEMRAQRVTPVGPAVEQHRVPEVADDR
jgi:hypothetical protein